WGLIPQAKSAFVVFILMLYNDRLRHLYYKHDGMDLYIPRNVQTSYRRVLWLGWCFIDADDRTRGSFTPVGPTYRVWKTRLMNEPDYSACFNSLV
ncbi:MAG: hypothetical protein AAGU32_14620, partial [Bacillota bacterium]